MPALSPADGDRFVPPPTRGEAVVHQLREAILSGRLAPGVPIRDADLAAQMSVSITPIRESIAVLISEGLVETLPNKRRCVVVLTQKRSQELMDVLGVIVAAWFERVENLGDSGVALSAACRGVADKARERDMPGSKDAFHQLLERLFSLVDNDELRRASDGIVRRALGMIQLYPSEHLFPLWVEAFDEIADLVIGDPKAAASRTREFFAVLLTAMANDRQGTAIVGHAVGAGVEEPTSGVS